MDIILYMQSYMHLSILAYLSISIYIYLYISTSIHTSVYPQISAYNDMAKLGKVGAESYQLAKLDQDQARSSSSSSSSSQATRVQVYEPRRSMGIFQVRSAQQDKRGALSISPHVFGTGTLSYHAISYHEHIRIRIRITITIITISHVGRNRNRISQS
jgi:hypothetical protein